MKLFKIYDVGGVLEMIIKNLVSTENNGFQIGSLDYLNAIDDINELCRICHGSAFAAGWWDKPKENGTRFMLIVSEIAEAMEGDRKNIMDDHLPHRKMVECELADALIRIFDMAGGLGIDLGGAFAEKLHYNQTRLDHTREARAAEHGKKY